MSANQPPGQGPVQPLDAVTASLVAAEFTALRSEIENRADKELQLSVFAVIALGTLFTAGFTSKNEAVILTYPILGAALAVGWAGQDRGIQLVGQYIAKVIEMRAGLKSMSWEHFIQSIPGFKASFRYSARLIFGGTEVMAIVVGSSLSKGLHILTVLDFISSGWSVFRSWTIDDVLVILGALSVVTTLVVLWRVAPNEKDVDRILKDLGLVPQLPSKS